MKKLDWYIIKKFLGTFFFSIGLIMAIAIVFDVSEKLQDFLEKKEPLEAIIFDYYLNFIPYFANLFSPLFIFISVIFFTAKMAANSEIVAILAGGISFKRMLRPYMLSATVLALLSLYLNNFLIPKANAKRLAFEENYIRNKFRFSDKNIHRQIAPDTYVYFESFNNIANIGYKFSLEKFNQNKLEYKLVCDYIQWDSVKTKWVIHNYYERFIDNEKQRFIKGNKKDTIINLSPEDFSRRENFIEAMDYFELDRFIEDEKFKGSENIPFYEVEKYKRIAFPFATFVLTLIGVSLSSRKVRGGIGMHIGIGLLISFAYILFMQVSTVMATNTGMSAAYAVWIPNVIFGILSLYLLKKAPK